MGKIEDAIKIREDVERLRTDSEHVSIKFRYFIKDYIDDPDVKLFNRIPVFFDAVVEMLNMIISGSDHCDATTTIKMRYSDKMRNIH